MSITPVGKVRLEQKRKALEWLMAHQNLWNDADFLKNSERRRSVAQEMKRIGIYSPHTQTTDLMRSQVKLIAEITRSA